MPAKKPELNEDGTPKVDDEAVAAAKAEEDAKDARLEKLENELANQKAALKEERDKKRKAEKLAEDEATEKAQSKVTVADLAKQVADLTKGIETAERRTAIMPLLADAYDPSDILPVLDIEADAIEIKEQIDEIRKAKPYLFKGKKSTVEMPNLDDEEQKSKKPETDAASFVARAFGQAKIVADQAARMDRPDLGQ